MNNRKVHQLILASGLILVFGVGSARADDLSSMAKKLTTATKPLKNKRLAVLLFPYANGDVSSGTSLVRDRLTILLGQAKDLQIIDKSHLALELSKISLGQTGVAPVPSAAKTSNDLSIDAIVTGTLEEVKHHRAIVNARLIQVPSGVILTEVSAKIKQTWYDPPQLPPEPENPNAPYVMHASPLIFTPQADMGDGGSPAPSTNDDSGNVTADVPVSAPVAYNAANSYGGSPDVVVIDANRNRKQEGHRDDKRNDRDEHPVHRDPHQATIRSEFYYAAGLTLEHQGRSQDVARLYSSAVKESPAPSPLQSLAEHRSKQDDTR